MGVDLSHRIGCCSARFGVFLNGLYRIAGGVSASLSSLQLLDYCRDNFSEFDLDKCLVQRQYGINCLIGNVNQR